MAELASLALQAAMRDALLADAPLLALLGGPRVYDFVPQGAALSLVVFAAVETRAAGTQTDGAEEHQVTLHVWSAGEGRKQAGEILAAIRAVLEGAALAPADHRLVNLGAEAWSVARIDADRFRGLLRFRAVTEPF